MSGSGTRSGAHVQRRRDFGHKGLFIASCPDCGKRRYATRRDAKRQARIDRLIAVRAYPCGMYWHLTSENTEATTRRREGAR